MSVMDSGASERPERRSGDRRRYNRRQSDSAPVPPYFETFDRMAVALERIAAVLQSSSTIRLPGERANDTVRD